MGTAIIKFKIMPSSPEIDLEELEEKAKIEIKKESKSEIRSEKEPIAFGLNALFLTFTWDESLSTDKLEKALKELPNVSSAEIVDFRRALG